MAFGYLQAHLPGVPLHDMRMLLNHPMVEINPGSILLKEGESPTEVLLLVSGLVEKLRTRDKLFASLSVGSLIGGNALLDNRASQHTYRAGSFVHLVRLPKGLFTDVVRRNGLLERVRRAADLSAFLNMTNLFGDGFQVAVLARIIDAATEKTFKPGEAVGSEDLSVFNIIRSGQVERLVGRKRVDILKESDFFGEEVAVFKGECLYRVHAIEETTVVQIPGDVLQNVPILRWKLFENCQQRAARFAHGCDHSTGMTWRKELSINVAYMDLHHKQLIEIANVVIENLYPDADRSALGKALIALIDYTAYHFAAEEKLMDMYGYHAADAHCLRHAELITQMTTYSVQVQQGVVPEKEDFLHFFESWLLRHIQEQDREYGRFINTKGVY